MEPRAATHSVSVRAYIFAVVVFLGLGVSFFRFYDGKTLPKDELSNQMRTIRIRDVSVGVEIAETPDAHAKGPGLFVATGRKQMQPRKHEDTKKLR